MPKNTDKPGLYDKQTLKSIQQVRAQINSLNESLKEATQESMQFGANLIEYQSQLKNLSHAGKQFVKSLKFDQVNRQFRKTIQTQSLFTSAFRDLNTVLLVAGKNASKLGQTDFTDLTRSVSALNRQAQDLAKTLKRTITVQEQTKIKDRYNKIIQALKQQEKQLQSMYKKTNKFSQEEQQHYQHSIDKKLKLQEIQEKYADKLKQSRVVSKAQLQIQQHQLAGYMEHNLILTKQIALQNVLNQKAKPFMELIS